ncbi:MAG: hypothetical protein ACRDZM_07810 [Acidimicrobiia bacterium]
MGVEVDIFHERMKVTAGSRMVADWPLEKLEVSSLSDGFYIKVDGEELVLNVSDSARFATELGLTGNSRSPSAPAAARPGNQDAELEDLQRRIADVARSLTSDSVAPAVAFAEWLRLLKEINRRHGQGSMSTPLFFRLNTELLDLIPTDH